MGSEQRLLRLSRARHWTIYALPKDGGYLSAAVVGPDGALWYTALKPGLIGRIDRHGHVTLYPLPFDAEPEHICVGPDGNLWYADPGAGSVHTSDGSRRWALQVSPTIGSRDDPQSFNGVACITARRCVVAGYTMYTTDSGARWVAAGGTIDFMTNAVACPTSALCYTVGAFGGIAVTHDGGKTWVAQVDASNNTPHLPGVACVTTRRCYAAGGKGTIVATSNGGNTWSRQRSGTRADLYGITCARSGRCYAVGDKGTVLTTG